MSLLKSFVREATLGSKVEFDSYLEWSKSLPNKSSLHTADKKTQAQSRSKDFEGVSGVWDHDKNKGWIYAHYLNKANLDS